MFTVNMYCSRMNARGIRIGLVIDCTALDLEEFDPLPDPSSNASSTSTTPRGKLASKKKKTSLDRRVRYFHNPSEWDDFDVEYCRLVPPKSEEVDGQQPLEAEKEEPPAARVLPQFLSIIAKFIQKSRSSLDGNSTVHIALFDSRGGLGVASYLAAAYMCHSMKAPVHAALDAVREGSPPQPNVEDKDRKWGLRDVRLVKDLQSRYRGKREIVMEDGVPSWWFAMEDDEDDQEEEKEDCDGETKPNADISNGEIDSPKRKRNDERIVIPPCEGAVDESNGSKRHCTSHDKMPPPNNGNHALFPNPPKDSLQPVPSGSQQATRAMTVLAQLTQKSLPMTSLPFKPEVDISDAASLESNKIMQTIKSNIDEYKVTWLSTKGRRGLLLILSEAVYFIEQPETHVTVSIVTNIKFPSPKDSQKQQHRSLLDVVLVQDIEKHSQCFRFYILDILCIEGGMVFHKQWKERWRFLNDGVLIPRKKEEAMQKQQSMSPPKIGHVYAKEPIRIRAKEYFPMQKLEFVMTDVCDGVGHEAKGVRIIPAGPYGIGKEDTTAAAVWKRGGGADERQLISLLLK